MKTQQDKLAELAAKVSNDISEGIWDKETKAELRDCIKQWANWQQETQRELNEAIGLLCQINLIAAWVICDKKNKDAKAERVTLKLLRKAVKSNNQFFEKRQNKRNE